VIKRVGSDNLGKAGIVIAVLRERIATVQHKAIDELSGGIAILKKYLKSIFRLFS
jgi:hypothetical protein